MGKQGKILIVDDTEMNRSMLADMLQEDYEILEAENGWKRPSCCTSCTMGFHWYCWILSCRKWTDLKY